MKKVFFTTSIFIAILVIAAFIRVEISSTQNSSLVEFLQRNNAQGEVAEAYKFALENPQNILSDVKCYCGCLSQGHKNSKDCFINENGTFDLMGLNCGLCVKTALAAKQMLAGGKSVQEISDFVDNRWGKNLQ